MPAVWWPLPHSHGEWEQTVHLGGRERKSRERAEWVGLLGMLLVQVSKGTPPTPTTSTHPLMGISGN